jgi:hypothetical protein
LTVISTSAGAKSLVDANPAGVAIMLTQNSRVVPTAAILDNTPFMGTSFIKGNITNVFSHHIVPKGKYDHLCRKDFSV